MNNGRIWCVVKPTVGLPLFLGAVATTSLIVHYTILSHTTWFSEYWNGGKATTASVPGASAAPVALTGGGSGGYQVSIAPVAESGKAAATFVISVTPQSTQSADIAFAGEAPK